MKILFYFCVFLLTAPLSAQLQNYQPGYYLSQAGDTIRTELSQEGSYFPTVRVRAEGGEVRSLAPAKIGGFGFTGQRLHYRSVPHTYTLEGGEEITALRFALVLVDGANTLYRLEQQPEEYFRALSDVKNHVYYLQKPSGEVFKLERVEEQSTQSRFRVLEKYRGGLRYLFSDWPEIDRRTERLKFRDEEMIEIVRGYNAFVDPAGESVVADISKQRETWHKFILNYSEQNFNTDKRNRSVIGADYSFRYRNALRSNSLTLGIGIGTSYSYSPDDAADNDWLVRVPLEAEYLLTHKSKFRPAASFFVVPTYGRVTGSVTRVVVSGGREEVFTNSFSERVLFGMAGVGLSAAVGPVGVHARVEYPLLIAGVSGANLKQTFGFFGLSYELRRKE